MESNDDGRGVTFVGQRSMGISGGPADRVMSRKDWKSEGVSRKEQVGGDCRVATATCMQVSRGDHLGGLYYYSNDSKRTP